MKINNADLTYCLNIHPGETWEENFAAIDTYVKAVREQVSPDKPFGLGLRPGAGAVEAMGADIERFKEYLTANNLYVMTANAFPYGQFHQTRVKEQVYQPDWTDQARVTYTKQVGEIMAKLGQGQKEGAQRLSVSTVPVAYGKDLPDEAQKQAVANFLNVGQYFAELSEQYGVNLTLGLEPEPDCYLETSDEMINFIGVLREQDSALVDRHIGVCLDTCHVALQQEGAMTALEKYRKAGVLISKVQLSAALYLDETVENKHALLEPFWEKTYLHQTRIVKKGEQTQSFSDLDRALMEEHLDGEAYVHFHVPLHFKGEKGGLGSTWQLIEPEFWQAMAESNYHLEIETYTFDVLPDWQNGEEAHVIQSIVGEFSAVQAAMIK